MENDSLAEMFFDKIMTAENPVSYLVGFFCALFSVEVTKDMYMMFAKLYRVYGREIVYFSILDCFDIDSIDASKPYGILVYFCKKRLQTKTRPTIRPDLDKFAETVLHDFTKERIYKIPKIA